jgi:4-amino-4-deoxy-L-arabinose transferase-like glycosyltransferase
MEPRPYMRVAPLLFLLYSCCLFIFLNNWGVIETSEARYAEIAREMIATGDWIHPRLLGIQHFHKPPVTYWITVIGYKVFGINPFGARFFLQISLMLQLYCVYRIVILLFRDRLHALYAAMIYATLPLVLVSSRGLTTDSYLTTCILLAITSWLSWRLDGNILRLYGVAIALAIGFLTKGPLVLLAPALVFIALNKNIPRQKYSVHHVLAFLLFMVIGFSWYAVLVSENRNFVQYFLFRQTMERITHAEVFSRAEPFWYYLLYTPLLSLPWSVVFITGSVGAWKDFHPVIRKLILWWIVGTVILFSCVSSKLVLYVLPVFPAIAIVTSYIVLRHLHGWGWQRFVFVYCGVLCLALLCALGMRNAFHLDLLLFALAALIAVIVVNCVGSLTRSVKMVLTCFLFTCLLLCYGARFMHYNELKVNGTAPVAAWIEQKGLKDKQVLVYNKILPSLSFNLRKEIISLNDGDTYLKRETYFESSEAWKRNLFDLKKPQEAMQLTPLLNDSSILIVKGKLSPSALHLRQYFKHEEVMEGWTIYY